MGFKDIDTDAMFDMIRKLHQNEGKYYDLSEIGLTDEEKKAVIDAVEAMRGTPVAIMITESNLTKAKLALEHGLSCDAQLFGYINICIENQIGKLPKKKGLFKRQAPLEKAFEKMKKYDPK